MINEIHWVMIKIILAGLASFDFLILYNCHFSKQHQNDIFQFSKKQGLE